VPMLTTMMMTGSYPSSSNWQLQGWKVHVVLMNKWWSFVVVYDLGSASAVSESGMIFGVILKSPTLHW
jgi:hypothetical protein